MIYLIVAVPAKIQAYMSQFQDHLFRQIREKLSPEVSLADAIAEVLHLSNDSAYRRIRGETPLVLEEAGVLCRTYGISLDHLFQSARDTVLFHSVQVKNEGYDFQTYLTDILYSLQSAAAADQKQIIYLAKDLPLFHYFNVKPLFAFRYFFWMKSILQHPDFISMKFSMDLLTPDIQALGAQIVETYNSIPSIEILNTECLNSLIAQVDYYHEAGYFKSSADVDAIYEAMTQMMAHVKAQAEYGSKFRSGENPALKKSNYDFYFNRLVLGDNTVMIIVNGKRSLFINYDVLNYIITEDERFCNDAYDKLQGLMRKGTILSTVSEKQRNAFFYLLNKKISHRVTTS